MRQSFRTFALVALVGLAPVAFAEEGGTLTLADNETFLLPLDAAGNAMPQYPAAVLVQAHEPKLICMRVDIDEDGEVTYAGPQIAPPNCPEMTVLTKQFVDAATAALTTWSYEEPAIKCVFRNKAAKEAAGMSCQGGRERPTATSMTYRFSFEQVSGQGVVKMVR